ncbi:MULTISPECIES: TetR/AcrR family transcriptional regulator [Desulfitobacterium]|uniref:Transcriptional regulator n=1 Tax=Desulfitobacterium dehalogenans (strain ATCC 51507 / DSM 9161 / JW/IU-DC1) TaxID=756499 RepID=I4AAA9_DESDJ|nr:MULTISPECIES: TetR/AcrR family transcriptional regulator [Desulfitobacterium]AFM00894.1 transcriptional regulator [Desulfitobacterium dehalogenans ATCC 51507]
MSELSRRERKKLETYTRLYKCAMELFHKQGYEQTSVEQITQLADVGKGTFYNYFQSKEAVVLEYSRRKYQELIASGREAGYSLQERLDHVLKNWSQFMTREKELAWVAVKHREEAELDKGLHYGIIGIISHGQRIGEISKRYDPVFLAESLEGMVLQHFLHWFVTGEGNLEKEMEDVLNLFFEGLSERKLRA